MKLYVAAIVAFSPVEDLEDGRETGITSITAALPGIVFAENIDEAAEQCRQQAFTAFKVAEGWSGHHADILPVTKEFFDQAFRMYPAMDLTPEGFEEGQSYSFDPSRPVLPTRV